MVSLLPCLVIHRTKYIVAAHPRALAWLGSLRAHPFRPTHDPASAVGIYAGRVGWDVQPVFVQHQVNIIASLRVMKPTNKFNTAIYS